MLETSHDVLEMFSGYSPGILMILWWSSGPSGLGRSGGSNESAWLGGSSCSDVSNLAISGYFLAI